MSRSPWHTLIRMWPLSLVQLYATEMSNDSLEVCPSIFTSLSLFTLLHKLILYLLCRSCSSVPFGTSWKRKLALQGLWAWRQTWLSQGDKKRQQKSPPPAPRKFSYISCFREQMGSVFATMFHVIQQILAERPWCARNGEGGRGGLGPAHEELLCSVRGCLWVVRAVADRSQQLGQVGSLALAILRQVVGILPGALIHLWANASLCVSQFYPGLTQLTGRWQPGILPSGQK